jgi:hypothetical protein
MSLQGETSPTISKKDMQKLQAWIADLHIPVVDSPKARVDVIKHGIKVLNLPRRHLRHAVAIATNVFEKNSSLLDLTGENMKTFSRYFRFLEHAWCFSDIKKRNKRKYFLNYSFLIKKMCEKWNVPSSYFTCMRSESLRARQEHLYHSLIQAGKENQKVKNTNVTFEF